MPRHKPVPDCTVIVTFATKDELSYECTKQEAVDAVSDWLRGAKWVIVGGQRVSCFTATDKTPWIKDIRIVKGRG